MANLTSWKDKALFTPGPLTTSPTVKQAMLRDLGSRDQAFIETIDDIRRRLVALGEAAAPDYTCVPMQGSGTFAVEAVLSSTIPRDGKLLVISNGAYGRRIAQIAEVLAIPVHRLDFPEDRVVDPQVVDQALAADGAISHVAIVHCETTTGLLNPIDEIGALVAGHGRRYFVDAMSSFGAVPLSLPGAHVDYLVSSANKCIEGVPGFAFVLARTAALAETAGWARSLSLDLHAQWRGLEANGQFRFTPPTHALLAFRQALDELDAEGGVAGRGARYGRNQAVIAEGMKALGFVAYLAPSLRGPIITSFRYPRDPRFSFERFYEALSERDFLIYPGKVSDADCFRIGHIGRLSAVDMRALLAAIRETLDEMGVTDCAPAATTHAVVRNGTRRAKRGHPGGGGRGD